MKSITKHGFVFFHFNYFLWYFKNTFQVWRCVGSLSCYVIWLLHFWTILYLIRFYVVLRRLTLKLPVAGLNPVSGSKSAHVRFFPNKMRKEFQVTAMWNKMLLWSYLFIWPSTYCHTSEILLATAVLNSFASQGSFIGKKLIFVSVLNWWLALLNV